MDLIATRDIIRVFFFVLFTSRLLTGSFLSSSYALSQMIPEIWFFINLVHTAQLQLHSNYICTRSRILIFPYSSYLLSLIYFGFNVSSPGFTGLHCRVSRLVAVLVPGLQELQRQEINGLKIVFFLGNRPDSGKQPEFDSAKLISRIPLFSI